MTQSLIPEFFVYGEPARAIDVGFLHVETVLARASVHRGRVLAHKHPQLAQITFWTSGSGVYRLCRYVPVHASDTSTLPPDDTAYICGELTIDHPRTQHSGSACGVRRRRGGVRRRRDRGRRSRGPRPRATGRC